MNLDGHNMVIRIKRSKRILNRIYISFVFIRKTKRIKLWKCNAAQIKWESTNSCENAFIFCLWVAFSQHMRNYLKKNLFEVVFHEKRDISSPLQLGTFRIYVTCCIHKPHLKTLLFSSPKSPNLIYLYLYLTSYLTSNVHTIHITQT